MGIIRLKSGRWNSVSGGAGDNHQSDCNDYELENMLGVPTFYCRRIVFFTVFVTVSKLLTVVMIIAPYLWYFRIFIWRAIFWALLRSSSSRLSFSFVSQVFLLFPMQLRSAFPIRRLMFYDSRTPCVSISVSLELRLPIGSLSGCLCEPTSCVCWMVCNYPQASPGLCSWATLLGTSMSTYRSTHQWTLYGRESNWEHRNHKGAEAH